MTYCRISEAFVNQVSVNTSNLSDLQNQLDQRVGKHVDLREAIIKKKDEQLKGTLLVYDVYVHRHGQQVIKLTLSQMKQHYTDHNKEP